MPNSSPLVTSLHHRTPAELFAYPAAAKVLLLGKSDEGEVHLIFHTDADPTANFANAPNGSLYVCLNTTAANNKLWIKLPDAAGEVFGATNAAWRQTVQLT